MSTNGTYFNDSYSNNFYSSSARKKCTKVKISMHTLEDKRWVRVCFNLARLVLLLMCVCHCMPLIYVIVSFSLGSSSLRNAFQCIRASWYFWQICFSVQPACLECSRMPIFTYTFCPETVLTTRL